MAPTEILANQHYKLVKKLLTKFNYRVSYISGKTKTKDKKEILKNLKDGKIDFIIGTHSFSKIKVKTWFYYYRRTT